MTPPKGICCFCHKPVEASQRAAFAVGGYEVERDAGGQNHVVRKKRIDGWIWHARHDRDCFHQHVVERHKPPTPEPLF